MLFSQQPLPHARNIKTRHTSCCPCGICVWCSDKSVTVPRSDKFLLKATHFQGFFFFFYCYGLKQLFRIGGQIQKKILLNLSYFFFCVSYIKWQSLLLVKKHFFSLSFCKLTYGTRYPPSVQLVNQHSQSLSFYRHSSLVFGSDALDLSQFHCVQELCMLTQSCFYGGLMGPETSAWGGTVFV